MKRAVVECVLHFEQLQEYAYPHPNPVGRYWQKFSPLVERLGADEVIRYFRAFTSGGEWQRNWRYRREPGPPTLERFIACFEEIDPRRGERSTAEAESRGIPLAALVQEATK